MASEIYITKACYMIKVNLLTSLQVDFCFIYYMESFSIDTVSEQNMPSPLVVPWPLWYVLPIIIATAMTVLTPA